MKTTHITATFGTFAGVITLFWFPHMRISHYWQSVVIMTRQLYQWTPQTVFCLSRGRSGFAPRTGRINIRCKILALYITDCVSLCLSDETLKSVGPFYLVYMPGEVKISHQSALEICNLSLTPHSSLENDNYISTTPVLAHNDIWAVWSRPTYITKN